jgi:hypothetical protein
VRAIPAMVKGGNHPSSMAQPQPGQLLAESIAPIMNASDRKMRQRLTGSRKLTHARSSTVEKRGASEVFLQLHKLPHLNQLQPFRSGIHRLMLQRPGKIMRYKHRVDARRQRRINV